MLKFLNIASGSKGNASLLFNEETLILIDCGVCKRELVNGLKLIKKKIEDIDLVLLTHEHIDHIKGINYVSNIPQKAAFFTENPAELNYFSKNSIKSIEYICLKASHDSPNTCGYLFKDKDDELVYITDTGVIPFETLELIKNKTYYVIESNHDYGMLIASNRTLELKERIASNYGHLSNEQCAYYLSYLIGDKTKKVLLAHLSEECNDEYLALETIDNYFQSEHLSYPNLVIECLRQHEVTWL